jgi:hypothetical protein
MERAQGSGAALAVTGLYLSFCLSLILSFICQRGRRVAGGELRYLAGRPEAEGVIKVLSYSN